MKTTRASHPELREQCVAWLAATGAMQIEAARAARVPASRFGLWVKGRGGYLSEKEAAGLRRLLAKPVPRLDAPAPIPTGPVDVAAALTRLDQAAVELHEALLRRSVKGAATKLGALKLYYLYRHGRPLPREKAAPPVEKVDNQALLKELEKLAGRLAPEAEEQAPEKEPDGVAPQPA